METGRGSDQFTVRFPEGMRSKLKEMARANRRSMNAEIILAIEAGMAAAGETLGGNAPAANRTDALASVNSTNG